MSAFIVEDSVINRVVSFIATAKGEDEAREIIHKETDCDIPHAGRPHSTGQDDVRAELQRHRAKIRGRRGRDVSRVELRLLAQRQTHHTSAGV